MERFGRLLLVVVVALSSTLFVHATDPSLDLGVCKIEGAPGCEFIDGIIVVGNQSTTHYYTIDMQVTCGQIRCTASQCASTSNRTNVVLAPKFCTPGQSPGCFEQLACVLRNCPAWGSCGSCQTCDNYPDDCGTPDQLCTNVSGSVTGVAWSTDGVNWTNFQTPPTIPVIDYCSGGNSCE